MIEDIFLFLEGVKIKWELMGINILPAVVYWNNTKWLMFYTFLFVFIYLVIYRTIIKFKVPKWLKV